MRPTRLSQLEAYQSPWLKALDIQGRAVAVVVEKVTVEELRQPDGKKETKLIVAFRGKAKRLILNKSQALALADFAKTEEFARWVGLAVVLEPGRASNGRDTVFIRPTAKAPAEAPATPTTTRSAEDDDNPFDPES